MPQSARFSVTASKSQTGRQVVQARAQHRLAVQGAPQADRAQFVRGLTGAGGQSRPLPRPAKGRRRQRRQNGRPAAPSPGRPSPPRRRRRIARGDGSQRSPGSRSDWERQCASCGRCGGHDWPSPAPGCPGAPSGSALPGCAAASARVPLQRRSRPPYHVPISLTSDRARSSVCSIPSRSSSKPRGRVAHCSKARR